MNGHTTVVARPTDSQDGFRGQIHLSVFKPLKRHLNRCGALLGLFCHLRLNGGKRSALATIICHRFKIFADKDEHETNPDARIAQGYSSRIV